MMNLDFSCILVSLNVMFSREFEFDIINYIFYGCGSIYMLHFTEFSFKSVFVVFMNSIFFVFYFSFWINWGGFNWFIDEDKISWSGNRRFDSDWRLSSPTFAYSFPTRLIGPSVFWAEYDWVFGGGNFRQFFISTSNNHIKNQMFSKFASVKEIFTTKGPICSNRWYFETVKKHIFSINISRLSSF